MLSPKLSKILAEKNVPHEGGMFWQHHCVNGKDYLRTDKQVKSSIYPFEGYIPAYPEIALFVGAKVIWKGELFCKNCEKSCGKDWSNQLDCGCDNREPIEPFTYHAHTLANLFSSGASEQEIENYVLESLEDK